MNLKLLVVLVTFLLIRGWVRAQSLDSLDFHISSALIFKLDSIQSFGVSSYSKMQKSYDSTRNATNIAIDSVYRKIKELQKHEIGTDRLTTKLDSLIAQRDKTIHTLSSEMEKLKSVVNERINSLKLPPGLREKAGEVTAMINRLDFAQPNTILSSSLQKFSNLSVPDLGSIQSPAIPGVEIDNPIQDITNIDIPSVNMGAVGNQVKEYQSQMSELPKDIDGAATLAEQQATNISAVADVQKELGQVDIITDMASALQDQEKLKEQLVNEVKEQAIDHFAGQKQQLNKAMQSISKHKQKFTTITSLNDIPKKAPNEMKGKPLIERIVPGIAFQLQKKNNDWLLDINPYVAYRFTKRFSTGAGWNQRIGYDLDKNSWSPDKASIYGPRVFSEYKLGKGFSPRIEIEVMNTFVPPFVKSTSVDPWRREWVCGAFVGMKKDYTLYKKIKGTAMVMLRLFDPERKSPYADVVNARFGFEFPMKKKVRH